MGHWLWLLQVSDDEYTKLLSEGIQPVSTIDPNFASFTYTPRSLPEDDTSMVRTMGTTLNCHHPLPGLGQVIYPNPGCWGVGVKGCGCTPEHLPAEQGQGWLTGDLAGHCHSLRPTLSPLQAILSMLQDMNFINNYKMDRQTLTR